MKLRRIFLLPAALVTALLFLAPMVIVLAYSLMTRSGKVDPENLRRRDPDFVAACEASGLMAAAARADD